MFIMQMVKKVYNKYLRYTNPIKYWCSIGATIGKDCEIYSSANFGSEPYLITVGNHVRINSGVQLITHDGGVWVLRGMQEDLRDIDLFGKISIGDNCHIGTNAIIMPGVTIGKNCIIGCAAVVTKDISDNSIAVGIPARVIERVEEYRDKHMDEFSYSKHMSKKEKQQYLTESW